MADRAGAVRLMRLAAGAAAPGSGHRRTARTQLGLVLLAQGDVPAAEHEMRAALAETPGDTNATFGLGQVHEARGELRQAARLYERVAAELPEADHLAALAEVERALGGTEASRRHTAAARGAFDRLAEHGTNVTLDRVLFEADLRRPGRCTEGDRVATRSLRLATRDALMLFRAGMAASCADRPAVARERLSAALTLNPAFSLRWAPVARVELARLTSLTPPATA